MARDEVPRTTLEDMYSSMATPEEVEGLAMYRNINEQQKRIETLLETISMRSEKDEELMQRIGNTLEQILNREVSEQATNKALQSSVIRLVGAFEKNKEEVSKEVVVAFDKVGNALLRQLQALGGFLTTSFEKSFEKNKPFNAAPVYKDIINQLSVVNDSIQKKPVPSWNWPQYASVGVRNKSFSNIDPAQNEIANTVGTGTRTVTTAGTAVQLSTTSVPCLAVYIQANEDNTGTIAVGDSSVVAAVATRRGIALYPTNFQKFLVKDLNLLYIDSTVSGDKISYYYEIS